MKKINYKKIIASLLSLFFLILIPIFTLQAVPANVPVSIKNPLGSNDVYSLLNKIMDIVTKVGSIVVVFFIIYSGYKFVSAGESDEDRTTAKEIFYATVIGAAILLGANIIANIVVNTVTSTTGVKIKP